MALRPDTAYPSQVNTTDPVGYPYGRAKNVAAIDDGTGTPLEEQWVSDLFGFEQALLSAARLTPTNVPDKVGSSQYLDAIETIFQRELQKTQVLNWPERVSFGSVAGNNSDLAVARLAGVGGAGDILCILDASKTVYRSADGESFLATATLSSAPTTKPELAAGKLDGVPALMANGGTSFDFYTSLDGASFTLRSPGGGPFGGGVPCYVSAANRWVAVSQATSYCAATNAAVGAPWSSATHPSSWATNSGGAKRVVCAGSTIVALPVSAYNKCLVSTDSGVTWTERTLPMTATWSGLAYSDYDGIWMAASDSTGPVVVSTDGLTWTTTASVDLYLGNDLAVIGPLWAMPTLIANAGGIVYSVGKGAHWNRLTLGKHSVATAGFKRILASDGRFLVGHADGTNLEILQSLRAPQ